MLFRRGLWLGVSLALSASGWAQIRAIPYVTGVDSPMAMIQDPLRPDTQYLVLRGGVIQVVQNGAVLPTDALDISALTTTGGERGLQDIAFAPDYGVSGHVYLFYTDLNGDIQIKRYTRSASNPLTFDPNSVANVISVAHPNEDNHNGGTLVFGLDGDLYAAFGDGGAGNDPPNNAQNPNKLLGKMIRIDPSGDDFPLDDTRNYHIPADNPFVDGVPISAMNEIWAFGYRNPFRFSFDDPALGGTGGMIVGDVGQSRYEEVDYEPAGKSGRNYGWRLREGFHATNNSGPAAYTPFTNPIFEYAHNGNSEAIIGGYIYHGNGLGASFDGRYFFADEVLGTVYSIALSFDANGEATAQDFQDHSSDLGSTAIGNPAAFAIDGAGNVYIVNLTGGSVSMIANTNRTLTGHVSLGDLTVSPAGRPVTVQVRAPGTATVLDSYTVTLDAGGNFTQAIGDRIGVYDVAVKSTHWLRRVSGNIAFGAGGATISSSLVNGDVNNDNAVTISDFVALRAAFGSSPGDGNWNAEADLNGDGHVTLSDFIILRSHFGQSGDG